jgi:hypothetical protein
VSLCPVLEQVALTVSPVCPKKLLLSLVALPPMLMDVQPLTVAPFLRKLQVTLPPKFAVRTAIQ